MSECSIPVVECAWFIHEEADFLRTLTWLQTKNGPAVDLTDYLAELWVSPTDTGGAEFLVSSNGTTTPGTSITIDGLNGIVTIFMDRDTIPTLKLEQGALARFDLTDTDDVKSAQFRVRFSYEGKYHSE